jgi:hypothetical protein
VSRPALLFITYYRAAPVAQLGVFKRCSRMIDVLLADFDVHMIHYGGLPAGGQPDPIVSRVHIHEMPSSDEGPSIERVMRRVAPVAVIFGEAPMRGPFRLTHRIATSLGLWQVVIENAFDSNYQRYVKVEWPDIDRWLFFGLPDGPVPARVSADAAVVPPLLRFPEGFGSFPRDRITVSAYDQQSLLTAARLLDHVPDWERIDFLVSAESRALLEERGIAGNRAARRVLELPPDATIYDSLARARVVFGKAGYGQIVESLQLGARMMCRTCAGGIADGMLPPVMRPHVVLLHGDHELAGQKKVLERWLAASPVGTWSNVAKQYPDTIAVGARTLAELVSEGAKVSRGPRGLPPREPPKEYDSPGYPLAFTLFAWFVQNKQWDDLRDQLTGATIWAFDRPLSLDEMIAMLDGMFADAVDLKFLRIGPKTEKSGNGLVHVTQTLALMWGQRGSWAHHEFAFDLHVGCRTGAGERRIAYLGLTRATPDPEAYAAAS